MKNKLIILLLPLLIACAPHTGNPNSAPKYRIVFLTDYFQSYLEALKIPAVNRDSVYEKVVFEPIFRDHFLYSQYSDLARKYLSEPMLDTVNIRKTISSLVAKRGKISAQLLTVLNQCNEYLKNDSLIIYICPAYSETESLNIMKGVYGFTAGSHQIVLSLCPDIEGWQEMLDYAAAHEFQHAQWTQNNFAKTTDMTLLDCMLFEGKADAFAHLLYPHARPAWLYSMSEQERAALWNRLRTQLNSRDLVLQNDVMYGSAEYPGWTGYIIGYDLMQAALKEHPGLNPDEWTNKGSEEILKMNHSAL